MNIFLLNNNFHYSYLVKYFPESILNESHFIVVSHRIEKNAFIGKKALFLENPVHTVRDILKIIKFKSILKKVEHVFDIDFQKCTLYVLSEQDFLNGAIIKFFKTRNSNIILLEDGTFTPVFLSISKKSLKFDFIFFYSYYFLFYYFVKSYLGIKALNLKFIYNMPAMYFNNEIYSKICITSNYCPNRKIPSEIINSIQVKNKTPLENFVFSSGVAVFANSPHYLDIGNSYFEILKNTMNYLISNYKIKEIIFCFHPRESIVNINRIKDTLYNNYCITYVENISTYECVKNTLPEYLFSYMSTTILELSPFCKENIFLIQKFPEIMFPEVSKKMIEYINAIEKQCF